MKKLFLLTLFVVFVNSSFCQTLSSYNFTAFSSPYVSLTTPFIVTASGGDGPGVSVGGYYDDCWYDLLPIGFNFVYLCDTFTTLSASANGWVVLGETLGTSPADFPDTYDNDLPNTAVVSNLARPILAALWADLGTTGPNLRYATTGTAPNRVFTIEWDSSSFEVSLVIGSSYGPAAASFEIKLYETTNIIDFAYNYYAASAATTGLEAIGITGGNGPTPTTGTQPYWSLNNTSAAPTPSMTTDYRLLTGTPASNQVYRWNPDCTGTPSPGAITATVTASCAPFSSVLSVPACYPTGVTLQWQSSPNGITWTNISGAIKASDTVSVTATTYYQCIYTCSYSLSSATTAPIELILNTPPAAITGAASAICAGSTLALADVTTGGSWVSGSPAVAAVGSATGIVTGVAAGAATISYVMPAGCYSIYPITIVTSPIPISGATALLCQGATISLTDGTPSGAWSSSNTSVATIGTSGIVGGLVVGTSTITYSLGTCFTTAVVTVNAAPLPISGTRSVCGGFTTTLSDATTGGTWSIVPSSAYATVGATTGVVTTGTPGVPAFVVVTYTAPGGCSITTTVTVNPAPGGMSGSSGLVCAGQTTTFLESSSGTWSSSNTLVATVGSTGIVTGIATSGGTATITFTLPTGCNTSTVVTVEALPSAIIPANPLVCIGGTVALTDTTSGGYWISNNTGIAGVDPIFGTASGVIAGVDTIVYTLSSTGCYAMVSLTVNAAPPPIGGRGNVCPGTSDTLTDVTGGTWSSSNTAVASIGLTTGIVWGGSAAASGSSTTITYTTTSGCTITETLTLSSLPSAFAATHVCVGQSATLSDSPPGGVWSTGSGGDATITSGDVVVGLSAGTATVTYTEDGCSITGVVTVNPAPGPIGGTRSVCAGSTTTLTDGAGTGTWVISGATVATVGSATGVVTGVGSGTVTITYSAGGTCISTAIVTVNALPGPFIVSGTGSYCAGGAGVAITLSGSAAGIKYYLYLGGVLTDSVTGTGVSLSFGLQTAAGTYTVTGINTTTGCSRVMTGSGTITITPLPAVYIVSGGGPYCSGGTPLPITLSGSDVGITYKLSNGAVVVASLSGTGLPLNFGVFPGAGTYIVTAYTAPPSSCSVVMAGSAVIVIEPLPTAYIVSGGGTICPGGAGVSVTLNNSTAGVKYYLNVGGAAVDSLLGTGGSLSFGPETTAGVYTVTAINATTGCTKTMTGSATITVSAVPVISGATAVCMGVSLPESVSGFSGGTWTSSNTSVATVVTATGTVWGVTTGTTNITYTTTSGCTGTTVVTVSPGPGPVSGPNSVCVGATAGETDIPSGGLWTSSSTAAATVVASGSAGGIVTGVHMGTATITYSLGSGCTVTKVMTVTPAPGPVVGSLNICTGACATLSDGSTGGTWSISSTASATVSGSGSVCGTAAGTAAVTYTLGGCTATATVTTNTAPGLITGAGSVCEGSTITLLDATSGGTWTSSATLIGTVEGGNVLGEIGGITTITYSLGGLCASTHTVTVNPISPIAGSLGLCIGTTTMLTDGVAAGTWVSGNALVATISGGGVVNGVSAGTSVITYTTGAGCTATAMVTVNTAPLPIMGIAHICVGGCTPLSDGVTGGTWTSGTTAIATVNSATGQVCGILAGTSLITYSLGSGCTKTVIVTVNGLPSAIGGLPYVCEGFPTTLTETTTGGTWSSINTSVASVNAATGTVTGGTIAGTATIIYSPSTGCPASVTVTVNPLPLPISGTLSVCVGSTTALSDATSGGTWSSSNTASAPVATITGVVDGMVPGVTTITYTAGGCSVTTLVTVLPPPPAITGGPMVCEGQSIALHDASPGGTWSTAPSSLATIDGTGNLWGVSTGTVLVSYTIGTGCTVASSIIVNALSPVTGDSTVCAGLSVTLTDTAAGGAWSSSVPSVATALESGLTTGAVTGAAPGTATIIYTLPTGCASSRTVTVNAAPPAITGPRSVCYGSTITLSEAVTGGTWSSSNTTIAIVNMTTGIVEGATASGASATISYTLSGTGCPAEAEVTVYPVPPAMSGASAVCIGSSITLTDALSGGVWTCSDTLVAGIDSTGTVTGIRAGTATISYIYGSCSTGMEVTVNGAPMAISGPSSVCQGDAIALTDPTGGGSWSSSNTVATVGSSSGIVTGANAGTSVISYSTGTGCSAVVIITVNAEPGGISETLCQGVSAAFADAPSGGTWSSGNTLVLLIDTLSGAASTPSSGTATVTYTTAAGCSVTGTAFVNPSPAPITGSVAICLGLSTTLNDTSAGGPWSSSNTSVATVDASGNVYGLLPGTATISYPAGICSATVVVTVNSAPSFIEGPGMVCSGSAVTLGDSPGGGTWNSSDTTIAAIGLYSGVVSGTSTAPVAETVYITYSLGVGCTTYTIITVNPAPDAITGTAKACAGQTEILFDGTVGGVWSSGSPSIAAISSPSAGEYTGEAPGTATIYYTLPVTGCAATQAVTVNPQPGAITGDLQICLGSSQALSDIPSGGAWSSSNTLIASVPVPAVGVVDGVALGAATITYNLGGCTSTATVAVNPLPAVFTVSGGGNYCDGGAGVPIGLLGSSAGVNYLLYHGSTATGAVPGTGGDLSFGLQRVSGSYTVIGISTSTGCSNVMAGSATVTIMPTVSPSVSLSVSTGAGAGDTVCAGTSTTFTPVPVNGGPGPAYQWSVNGVPVSTSGAYTYVPANGDEVSVILTSDATCPSPATASGTVRMTVWSQELPVAGVSVSPGDTVCQGNSVTLSAMPLYGGLSPSYTWMKNGLASGAGAVYRYEPVNGDELYLSMTSDYPCRTAGTVASNVITMAVDTPQLPLVAINASPGTSAGIGLFDTLTAVVTNGGTNPRYQWVVNELPVAGATTNTFISNNYSYPNEDSVTCLVTSSGECSATSFGWVYISEHPAGVTTQATGGGFTIQPNPNNGSFTVRGTTGTGADEEVTIEITDMLGQSVYVEKIQSQNGRINERISLGQAIANGMYLLNVRTGEGNNVFHIVVEQ